MAVPAPGQFHLAGTDSCDREVCGGGTCRATHGVGDGGAQYIAAAEDGVSEWGENCIRGLAREASIHPFKTDFSAVA